ncbi:dephospho-CoA kinase [Lacihabitans soyangensis]|uniref:Dephospho-CoA kinase n=1 Tax=Lacihabitans soyangensis TaxID=869394 RepID=A0AAE3KRW3_9BACT|nr:dephospho-CoA kinase [Lacihabitans soyangensis]MCP9762622.1 dephospho-CoA kinase [Lacihabitans soyangensis]
MLKVGLTGGIGSGKSLVAKLFSLLEVPIYESDQRAKWLIEHHETIISEIKELLGDEAYNKEGKYNKEFVSKAVFQNKDLLKKLNQIVHPRVGQDFEDWLIVQNAPFVIKEAAIMNRNAGLDKIIVVDSPKELKIKRLLIRDTHRNLTEIENILANQKSPEEFLEMADFVINNDEKSLLIPQVLEIYKKLIS